MDSHARASLLVSQMELWVRVVDLPMTVEGGMEGGKRRRSPLGARQDGNR